MELSIVTTMYRSAPYLDEFHRRAVSAAGEVTEDFEVVLVNDGCPEGSLAKARDLARHDERIVIVDLSRNFGHHVAMLAGLAHARGDRMFLIDCDLEEDPALLLDFTTILDADTDLDVVYGVQERRRDRIDRRFAAALYYTVFNALSTHPVPRNLLTVRLMTRRYVDALLRFGERETQIAGLWELTGFDQRAVTVTKLAKGNSTYSISRRTANLVNAITSFSARPLVMLLYLGLSIMLLAMAVGGYFIYRKLTHGIDPEGFAALIVAVSFFGGLSVAVQGIIGIYVAKIFIETKKRPRAIVRAVQRSNRA